MEKLALITGGAGFIGSHLAELLLARGWRVWVIDDFSTGQRENLAAIIDQPRFRLIHGAVEDKVLTGTLVKDADAVFHLAAVVGVKKVMENTVGTINRNLHSTQTLLDACAAFGKRTVIASTSEVYGENPQTTFKESAASIIGNSRHRRWCYAATKLLDEFYAYAHFHSVRLPVTIARLFNTIGPRQVSHYGMVVPNFIAAAKANLPLLVHGDGTQARCFTSVHEVARALADLETCDRAIGQTYNIGSDQEISIGDLAKLIVKMTGSRSEIIYRGYAEIYGENFVDLQRLRPDLTALTAAIGYAPSIPLVEILRELIG